LLCSPSTLCRRIGLLLIERLDTLSTSSDSKISGFTRPHVIGFVADLFFPLWRTDLFFPGFAVEFAGYVWMVAVSGKKKLRIRKISGYVWTGPKITETATATATSLNKSLNEDNNGCARALYQELVILGTVRVLCETM